MRGRHLNEGFNGKKNTATSNSRKFFKKKKSQNWKMRASWIFKGPPLLRRGGSTCVFNLSSDCKSCLEPPAWSLSPLAPGSGEGVFGVPKVHGEGFWKNQGQSPTSWQVTFKMRCRGLQRTAWSWAWQAIDWKLTPGQLLIAVGNNLPPQPTICCLSTEGTVQGSTPGSPKRALSLGAPDEWGG